MEFKFPNCVFINVLSHRLTRGLLRFSCVFVLCFKLADVGEGETRGVHLVISCNYTVADATESYALCL